MKKNRKGFLIIRNILSTLIIYFLVIYPTRAYFYGYRFNDHYTLNIEDQEELLLSTVIENGETKQELMTLSEKDSATVVEILSNNEYTNNFFGNISSVAYQLVAEDNVININLKGKVSIFRKSAKSNSYAFYTGKVSPEEIRKIIEILSDYH